MKIKTHYYFLVVIALSYIGCDTNNNTIDGTWKSIGYGKILTIQSDTYEMFDITQISCLPARKGSMSEFEGHIGIENDTLFIKEGFDVYYFQKTEELPGLCSQKISKNKLNDPQYNFEVFAKTYEEQYAYFKLNNLNPDSIYSRFKDKITPETTEAELYLVLEDMLNSLNDNHGYLEPTDEVYELAEKLKNGENDTISLKEYGDFEIAGRVAAHYLIEDLTKDSRIIKWGKVEGNIGYIQVKAMMLYADLKLPDSLIQEKGFVAAYFGELEKLSAAEQVEAEVKGVQKIMDNVMKDLMATQAIILDVRFNGGGTDDTGLEILRRFNPEKHQVATKKARHINGYTKEVPIYLEAARSPYTKPVYLLTSQQSASATDFMALSSLGLDHVTRIGSHTQGAVSDALARKLPNGWHFSLSNEVYLDNQGICYENSGVPVDYELNYPNERQTFFRSVADDLEQDKQNVLKAIKALKTR